MKLIGSLTSPYVRKVRVVMAEKKLDYRFEVEDVWAVDATVRADELHRVIDLEMPLAEHRLQTRSVDELHIIIERAAGRAFWRREIAITQRSRSRVAHRR